MPNDHHVTAQVADPEAPILVEAKQISKNFAGFFALNNVSFQMRKGEILGLLGPNGAGKTTAMRILAGYFPPSRGNVFIQGEDLLKNPKKVKQKIGYLPETVSMYRDMKIEEYLRFVANVKGISRQKRNEELEDKMEQCGLWNIRQRLIKNLSKGYKQRLGLAQALIGNPEVLLLDEPTSGLDPTQIVEIRSLVRELGRERTIVLSTHILPEVNMVCDRVLIMNEGQIAASGTVDELEAGLQTQSEVLITFSERHRKEEVMQLLGNLSGVRFVRLLEEHGDRVTLSLSVPKSKELRPEITEIFVKNKIPLLEMKSGKLTLEEIFMRLVVKEEIASS